MLFLQWLQQCVFSATVYYGSLFSTTLPTLIDLFTMTILTSLKWYLIVVFICISLMASDAEHSFLVSGPSVYVPPAQVSAQVLCPFLN